MTQGCSIAPEPTWTTIKRSHRLLQCNANSQNAAPPSVCRRNCAQHDQRQHSTRSLNVQAPQTFKNQQRKPRKSSWTSFSQRSKIVKDWGMGISKPNRRPPKSKSWCLSLPVAQRKSEYNMLKNLRCNVAGPDGTTESFCTMSWKWKNLGLQLTAVTDYYNAIQIVKRSSSLRLSTKQCQNSTRSLN